MAILIQLTPGMNIFCRADVRADADSLERGWVIKFWSFGVLEM
jgi:hypothetical protein